MADYGIRVELSKAEIHDAIAAAVHQLRVSDEAGLNHAISYEGSILERVEREIVGAIGERAMCKAYGLEWAHRVGRFHQDGDVGHQIEVRATKHEDGHLIVREADQVNPDRWFFLVTGIAPVVTIRGAARARTVFGHGRRCRGTGGKQDQWWLHWSKLPYLAGPRRAVST